MATPDPGVDENEQAIQPLCQMTLKTVMATASRRLLEGEDLSQLLDNVSLSNEAQNGELPPGKLYTIVAMQDKGKGMIAAVDIFRGTRIMAEKYLFKLPGEFRDSSERDQYVNNELEKLSQDQQEAFFDLKNSLDNTYSQAAGIAKTNGFAVDLETDYGGVFLDASRINHACKPNAHHD
jgi:hypothetical protein